jgi:hypothetical protein
MPDIEHRINQILDDAEHEPIPAPSTIKATDAEMIEFLQREVAARDRTIALMEKERAQGTAPGAADLAAGVDPPAPATPGDTSAVDESLREANQRLRSHLRAAEAMIALRDGVSVDELTVPWPKQTPHSGATRR